MKVICPSCRKIVTVKDGLNRCACGRKTLFSSVGNVGFQEQRQDRLRAGRVVIDGRLKEVR